MRILFQGEDVMVSSFALTIGQRIFTLDQITGARGARVPLRIVWPAILCLAGIFTYGVATLLGIAWLLWQRGRYELILATMNGDIRALRRRDAYFVFQLVQAINSALREAERFAARSNIEPARELPTETDAAPGTVGA